MTPTRKPSKWIVFFSILSLFLLLVGCSDSGSLPPAPMSGPSMPSAVNSPAKLQRAVTVGKAYDGGKMFGCPTQCRADLIDSSNNLFLDTQKITFLPGENSKTITLTARDTFVWKDAYSLKKYGGQSDYKLYPLELNGDLLGLRWISKESITPLTITRADLNTAKPYHDPTNPNLAGYHGVLYFLVYTQPGAGNNVVVDGKERSVWLITTLWYRAYNDADEAPPACVGENKWFDATKCCGDDANEFPIIGVSAGTSACCPKSESAVVDGDCIAPVILAPVVISSPPPPPPSNDLDLDTIGDDYEKRHGLNPTDPADAAFDTDGDGMTHWAEYQYFVSKSREINPNKADTDGDGFTDKQEIDLGYNPIDAASKPPTTLANTATPEAPSSVVPSLAPEDPAVPGPPPGEVE